MRDETTQTIADPPGLAWLIKRLGELRAGADHDLIRHHALKINSAVGAIRGRQDRRGYKLEPSSGGFRRVRAESIGIARSLEQLKRAAKAAIRRQDSNNAWMAAWAAVSQKTRSYVWQPSVPPVTYRRRAPSGELIEFRRSPIRDVLCFHAAGLAMIAPYPADALPLIQAAIERLRSTPAAVRRKRTDDKLVAELKDAIRCAYAELTGRPTPKPVSWGKDLDSPLIQLARDISKHELFKLKVFNAVDSRRLRKF